MGSSVAGVPLLVASLVALPSPLTDVRSLTAFSRIQGSTGSVLHLLVDPDPGPGSRLGLVFQCGGRRSFTVAVFLGPLPPDGRFLHLEVLGDGSGPVRFGPPLLAQRPAPFHAVYLHGALRADFARLALRPGAVVSNGYRSFRNDASAAANRRVRRQLARCGV